MRMPCPCTHLALQDLDARRFFPLSLRIALNGQQFTNPLNYTYQRAPLQPYSLPSSGPIEGNTNPYPTPDPTPDPNRGLAFVRPERA